MKLSITVFSILRIARKCFATSFTPMRASCPFRVVLGLNMPETAFDIEFTRTGFGKLFTGRNVEILNLHSQIGVIWSLVQITCEFTFLLFRELDEIYMSKYTVL